MRFNSSCCLILAVLLLKASSFSQTSDSATSDKDKAKQELEKRVVEMLDQTVLDAANLKLAHNRAIIYALAGDLYWKFDEKQAGSLFRRAGAELMIVNADAEKERRENDDPYAGVFDFSTDVRQEVLPLIAKRDPELALELLVQTRPQRIAEALAKALQPIEKPQEGPVFGPDRFRAQQEIALEQRFALLVAENDPDKAIKLIKDSLVKGVSYNVLPLLQRLHQKSDKKAAELASEVIKKIVDTDLARYPEDRNAAISLLQFAVAEPAQKPAKEKAFKFSESQVADLANKLANTFLQPNASTDMTMALSRLISSLEKVIPERATMLKLKLNDAMSKLPPEMRRMQDQQKVWDPNATPEEILALLSKLRDFEKVSAHESLIRKIAQIDDEARAKKLIEQISDEKIRERATEQFESAKISRQAGDGRLEDAKKSIANLTKKKTQVQKLVSLAVSFHKKGTEKDVETAAGLMKDAKSLTTEFPEDEDELGDLMEVIGGYTTINLDEAFRLVAPIMDQVNEVVSASAVLSKYNKRMRTFRKGELVLRLSNNASDGMILFRYARNLEQLGKADLNRMSSLSDRLQRSDARSIVRLFMIQGFMKEEKANDPATNVGGASISIAY